MMLVKVRLELFVAHLVAALIATIALRVSVLPKIRWMNVKQRNDN
jgi:hypothetical protein